jgi:hypothetical protein
MANLAFYEQLAKSDIVKRVEDDIATQRTRGGDPLPRVCVYESALLACCRLRARDILTLSTQVCRHSGKSASSRRRAHLISLGVCCVWAALFSCGVVFVTRCHKQDTGCSLAHPSRCAHPPPPLLVSPSLRLTQWNDPRAEALNLSAFAKASPVPRTRPHALTRARPVSFDRIKRTYYRISYHLLAVQKFLKRTFHMHSRVHGHRLIDVVVSGVYHSAQTAWCTPGSSPAKPRHCQCTSIPPYLTGS